MPDREEVDPPCSCQARLLDVAGRKNPRRALQDHLEIGRCWKPRGVAAKWSQSYGSRIIVSSAGTSFAVDNLRFFAVPSRHTRFTAANSARLHIIYRASLWVVRPVALELSADDGGVEIGMRWQRLHDRSQARAGTPLRRLCLRTHQRSRHPDSG